MKITIGNDIHLGSKHATHTVLQLLNEISRAEGMLVLNGDIVDMANCPKKEVAYWKNQLIVIRDMVEAKGGIFVRGNHELNQIVAPDFVCKNDIFISHGHLQFWSKERNDSYLAKKPGAGFLKRNITPLYDHLRHFADAGPNELFYKNMDKIIKEHNPKVAFWGHRHPKENIIFDYKGVKNYILKRGIQTIDLGAM